MSFDHYHFQMVLRQERMSPTERLEADLEAARIAHGTWRLGRAAGRALRTLVGLAHPDPRRPQATMQPRRNA